MCAWFDGWWDVLLAVAFAVSLAFLLLRLGVIGAGRGGPGLPPRLAAFRLAGMGLVAALMLLLFLGGLLCAGSPGDFPPVVPE